jgi:hypothetical protein
VCDGGYFESQPNPNIYAELSTCQADAPNVGRVAGDCQQFTSRGQTWSTSDPATGDLMVDYTVDRELDTRRINWLFDQCRAARC